MGYTSINISSLIIEDNFSDPQSNPATSTLQPEGEFGKGMYDEDGNRVEFGFGASGAFPADQLIDITDKGGLQARIKEIEELGADCRSRAKLAGLICKNQANTNFCWANAPTYCYEVSRVYTNADLIYFSPGSIAGPINGFRNQGGWGGEALKRMIAVGVAPVSIYPANQVSKPSNFNEAMTVAGNYKVLEWWSLKPRNMAEVVSCLLRGWPVAAGYNFWSHEVSLTRALWMDGELAIEFRNSWGMSYGEEGYGVLRGNKMPPDDACTPRVSTPTGNLSGSLATAI